MLEVLLCSPSRVRQSIVPNVPLSVYSLHPKRQVESSGKFSADIAARIPIRSGRDGKKVDKIDGMPALARCMLWHFACCSFRGFFFPKIGVPPVIIHFIPFLFGFFHEINQPAIGGSPSPMETSKRTPGDSEDPEVLDQNVGQEQGDRRLGLR